MLRATALLVPCLFISTAFATHTIFATEPAGPASAEKVEQLVRDLAACPELGNFVADALSAEQGLLQSETVDALRQEASRCQRHRELLPPQDRYRLAYSSLKSLVAGNTAPPITTATPNAPSSTLHGNPI